MLYLPLLLNTWSCLEDKSSSLLPRPIVLQSLVPTCFTTLALDFSSDPEDLDQLVQGWS